MITIESHGKDILLFGRNGDTPTIELVKDFKPYFYVEDVNGKYITINKKKATKVFCRFPKDVVSERLKHKNTYEADIIYTNRYIIDRIEKIESEKIRLCYIDIEIERTKNGYGSAMEAVNPINCIGVYDSFDKEYTQFCIDDEKDEKQMMQEFMNYIKDKNPDILIAWNGDMFDFPFLVNRINKIGLDAGKLSRGIESSYVKELKNGRIITKIYGRILFDLMFAYKKHFAGGGRESWSLDYISKYELKDLGGKEEYKGELDDLYKTDKKKFLQYNKRDVELLLLLDEKLRIINFFDEIRRLAFCRFEDVFKNSKTADYLCLKYAKNNNFVLPSVTQHIKEPYKGGFVRENEPKLYSDIAVMDMKSLYPSIMIGFNTSYETYDMENGTINIHDKFKFTEEKGIIPSIVKPLLIKRTEVRKEMETCENDSQDYKTLDITQYALKVIANSFYGVMGFKFFRLYKHEVAESVTYIARMIINEVASWFEKQGFIVIYGDTDSVFLEIKDKTIDDMNKLKNEINLYFKEYFKQFNVKEKNNIFELEFEKVYSKIFFKKKRDGGGVKKKYAGRLSWKDGKYVDEFEVVGFESRRSDSPQVGRDFLHKILRMIVYGELNEEIIKFVEDFKNKIKDEFSPEQIALPIGISKALNTYGNVIHVRAARNANELHNAKIRKGDKIKYLYVKNPCGVIGFKDYLWDGYIIDYDKMIRRIVDLKIGPIFEMLNWEYQYAVLNKCKKIKEKEFFQKSLW